MSRTRRLLILGLLLPVGATLNGQSLQPAEFKVTLSEAATPLYGPWKFTIGDSPVDPKTGKPLWAEPDFDDSHWETVDLTPKQGALDPFSGVSGYVPGWAARGHSGYWGYAWYRIRVLCHSQAGRRLALAGPPSVDDGYQAFVDGELLGSFGDFTGKRPITVDERPVMFHLEPSQEGNALRVIAFRLWMEPATLLADPNAGGIHSAPVLGEAAVVELDYRARWVEQIEAFLSDVVTALVYALLAAMALSLIFFDPSDPVYLWIGILFLATAAYPAATACAFLTDLFSANQWLVIRSLDEALICPLWVVVLWDWFGRARFRWLPAAMLGATTLLVLSSVLSLEVFSDVLSHPTALRFHVLSRLLEFIIFGLLLWIVVDGSQRHRLDGWILFPIVILRGVGEFSAEMASIHIGSVWFPFGVRLPLIRIATYLIALPIAVLLLRRLSQSLKRQREMALDVRQAQEIQEVILPERRILLPGFEIDSEYRPAREVGGDFFQIIPHVADSSLLIVAGDVGGKGLKAGMLVALLVGAIRTAAEGNSHPAAILAALNRRLLGRGNAHATCVAIRIQNDGCAVLANAGHPPPYFDGVPMEIEGSLPLGLLEKFDCTVFEFRMYPADRLLVLSDGVPEATNHQGSLFGFDRVLDIVRTQPCVSEIADSAQTFGQEDDISVISVTRVAVAEAVAAVSALG